jgi:Flp pilus assembly pilin Flp
MEEGQMEQVKAVMNRMLIALAAPSLKREEGQTLVEYALIIVTISIGVTAAMLFLRGKIAQVFSDIGNAL